MPTDLTGTPTSLGIGTYNVDTDAPSGLGFNEAMGQINDLIADRLLPPSSPSVGDAMVWDGSGWVKSSTTPLSPSAVGAGSGSNGQVLTLVGGVAAWSAIPSTSGKLDYVTSTTTSTITAATEQTANAIISGNNVAYDGVTPVRVDALIPWVALQVTSAGSGKTYSEVWRVSATGQGTVTITIASPGVVTLANHGLSNGDFVVFATTGTLPTGLTAGTQYFVVNATTNTFSVAATQGGAAINTSGTQSGTQSITTSATVVANVGLNNVSTTTITTVNGASFSSFDTPPAGSYAYKYTMWRTGSYTTNPSAGPNINAGVVTPVTLRVTKAS